MIYWNSQFEAQLSGQQKKRFLAKKHLINQLHNNGSLSGVEISRFLNLSIPTTQAYINELITEEFIEYLGKGESIGGRRPNMYGLVKNAVYILAIDISQTSVKFSIFNNQMENISGLSRHTLQLSADTSIINQIHELAKALLKKHAIDETKIMGIGVNIPGLVDSYSGVSYSYLNDSDISIQNIIANKFNLPVFIENDSKARALAERMHGSAKDLRDALVIQLDWGVGMGMILNGKLYRGNSGFSGEFSHTLIEEDGLLCTCGKRGCLETIASGRAMVQQATVAMKESENTILHQVAAIKGQLTHEDIVNAAKKGDQLAIGLINDMGQKLGKGISYLIQILNPETIILGGAIAQAKEYLLNPVNQALLSYCIPKLREDTTIQLSSLGKDAGVLGAASIVLQRSMNQD